MKREIEQYQKVKRKIEYDLTIKLWRGDHAAPEELDLQLYTDEPAWSERWIAKVVSRIWDLTMYDTIQIWSTLESITIRNIK